MLLNELEFADGEAVTKEKILQGVVVEDIEHVEGGFVGGFEVVAKIGIAQAEEGLAGAGETAEGFAGVLEILRPEFANGIDGGELRERIEFLEFAQRLIGKRDLEHRREARARRGPKQDFGAEGGGSRMRFNPRPGGEAGATGPEDQPGPRLDVSIRAPAVKPGRLRSVFNTEHEGLLNLDRETVKEQSFA